MSPFISTRKNKEKYNKIKQKKTRKSKRKQTTKRKYKKRSKKRTQYMRGSGKQDNPFLMAVKERYPELLEQKKQDKSNDKNKDDTEFIFDSSKIIHTPSSAITTSRNIASQEDLEKLYKNIGFLDENASPEEITRVNDFRKSYMAELKKENKDQQILNRWLESSTPDNIAKQIRSGPEAEIAIKSAKAAEIEKQKKKRDKKERRRAEIAIKSAKAAEEEAAIQKAAEEAAAIQKAAEEAAAIQKAAEEVASTKRATEIVAPSNKKKKKSSKKKQSKMSTQEDEDFQSALNEYKLNDDDINQPQVDDSKTIKKKDNLSKQINKLRMNREANYEKEYGMWTKHINDILLMEPKWEVDDNNIKKYFSEVSNIMGNKVESDSGQLTYYYKGLGRLINSEYLQNENAFRSRLLNKNEALFYENIIRILIIITDELLERTQNQKHDEVSEHLKKITFYADQAENTKDLLEYTQLQMRIAKEEEISQYELQKFRKLQRQFEMQQKFLEEQKIKAFEKANNVQYNKSQSKDVGIPVYYKKS